MVLEELDPNIVIGKESPNLSKMGTKKQTTDSSPSTRRSSRRRSLRIKAPQPESPEVDEGPRKHRKLLTRNEKSSKSLQSGDEGSIMSTEDHQQDTTLSVLIENLASANKVIEEYKSTIDQVRDIVVTGIACKEEKDSMRKLADLLDIFVPTERLPEDESSMPKHELCDHQNYNACQNVESTHTNDKSVKQNNTVENVDNNSIGTNTSKASANQAVRAAPQDKSPGRQNLNSQPVAAVPMIKHETDLYISKGKNEQKINKGGKSIDNVKSVSQVMIDKPIPLKRPTRRSPRRRSLAAKNSSSSLCEETPKKSRWSLPSSATSSCEMTSSLLNDSDYVPDDSESKKDCSLLEVEMIDENNLTNMIDGFSRSDDLSEQDHKSVAPTAVHCPGIESDPQSSSLDNPLETSLKEQENTNDDGLEQEISMNTKEEEQPDSNDLCTPKREKRMKSQRRRTFALHEGSLLIGDSASQNNRLSFDCSTPSTTSLSSVSASSKTSALVYTTNSNAEKEGTSPNSTSRSFNLSDVDKSCIEVLDKVQVESQKDAVSPSTQFPSTATAKNEAETPEKEPLSFANERTDATPSKKKSRLQSKNSIPTPLRRSRRKSILPDRFKGDMVIESKQTKRRKSQGVERIINKSETSSDGPENKEIVGERTPLHSTEFPLEDTPVPEINSNLSSNCIKQTDHSATVGTSAFKDDLLSNTALIDQPVEPCVVSSSVSVPLRNQTIQADTALSSEDIPATVISRQRKRKRKNIHLAGGGMITSQDMEAIARESRKRSMGVVKATGRDISLTTDETASHKPSCVKVGSNDERARIAAQGSKGSSFSSITSRVGSNSDNVGLRKNRHDNRSTVPNGILRRRGDKKCVDKRLMAQKIDDTQQSSVFNFEEDAKIRFSENNGAHQSSCGNQCIEKQTVEAGQWNITPLDSSFDTNFLQTKVHTAVDSTSAENDAGPFVPFAEQIQTKVIELFATDVLEQPCTSARLFASIALMLENDSNVVELKNPFQGDLLELCQLLVEAELTSLSRADTQPPYDQDSPPNKRIQFCSFDYSSTMPPVDTQVGSNGHVESCIVSLHKVARKIDCIRTECNNACTDGTRKPMKENVLQSVNIIISYLKKIEKNATLQEECSKAMPRKWGCSRFVKASRLYCLEFEDLLSVIMTTDTNDVGTSVSPLRRRLGDFIGSAIRFYLRRFFNPIPLPLTTPSSAFPPQDLSSIRSCVHEIVEMTEIEGKAGRDTAVADGSISSVFTSALRRIYFFYQQKEATGKFITKFCVSEASRRGLGPKDAPIVLSDYDLDEILVDIDEAHISLAGARACKFMRDLLNWPGVAEAIQNAGGWAEVEAYAKMFGGAGLEQSSLEEAFFVLLEDVESFMQRLNAAADEITQIEQECQDRLRLIWTRFRCGTRKADILAMNPKITVIGERLREGKKCLFPTFQNSSCK